MKLYLLWFKAFILCQIYMLPKLFSNPLRQMTYTVANYRVLVVGWGSYRWSFMFPVKWTRVVIAAIDQKGDIVKIFLDVEN